LRHFDHFSPHATIHSVKLSFTSFLEPRIRSLGSIPKCGCACIPVRSAVALQRAYLATICRDMGAELAHVGGAADHVHIVTTLPRIASQVQLIKQIKKTSHADRPGSSDDR
jgi:hypothetical protein